MPLHLVTPFDRTDPSEDEQPVSQPVQTLRSRMADGCYILLRGCLFLGSSYLMALGLPLLFFLLLSGGNPDAFFAHVANLGDRFLAADLARRRSNSRQAVACDGSRISGMPVVSVFFGIVIRMFYREHGVGHFHVEHQ